MKNKTKTRIVKHLALLMTVITVVSLLTAMIPVSAANYSCTMSLDELKSTFPEGRYWNHVGLKSWSMTTTTSSPCTATHRHGNCKYNGSCGCNDFKDSCIQCMGFAYTCQYLAFNKFNGYSAARNYTYKDAMSKLKAGDVIRYGNHSIFVTGVNGDRIYFMDCNRGGNGCKILHDGSTTKSAIKGSFKYVTHAPCELITDGVSRVNLYETATVTSRTSLTIRQYPDINSAKVGSLSRGAVVNVCHYPLYDNSGYEWRRLMDGRGWVCADYLNVTSGNYIVSGNYKIQAANGKFITYASDPNFDVNIVMQDDLSGTNRADYQIWNFEPLEYFTDTGAVIYRISPVKNMAFSLDCDGGNNELLHLWEKLDIQAQKWIVEVRQDGSLRILNEATWLALDILFGSNENNAEVITYNSHDENNQKFYLVNP